MNVKQIGALFILAALWGASFLFIRIAAPEIGPFLTIQGRVTIAGIALLLFMWVTKRTPDFKMWWKQYLMIGALNAAIPFIFIATAAIHLNASISAILNSLTPLFTALVVWGWMKESLSFRKWAGIMLGVVGVFILVGWSPIPSTQEAIISIVLCILSTVSYGFAGVYAKKTFAGVPPLYLAAGQQMGASVLLLPITIFNLPTSIEPFSTTVIVSVVGLALLCTAIAYLLYFYLIENVGPTKTLSVTFLIPLFGMVWGAIFLHEEITMGMMLGLVVILSSVLLISDVPIGSKLRMKKADVNLRASKE